MSQLATALRGIAGGIQALGKAEQIQRQEKRVQRTQDLALIKTALDTVGPQVLEISRNNPEDVAKFMEEFKTSPAGQAVQRQLGNINIFSTQPGKIKTEIQGLVVNACYFH